MTYHTTTLHQHLADNNPLAEGWDQHHRDQWYPSSSLDVEEQKKVKRQENVNGNHDGKDCSHDRGRRRGRNEDSTRQRWQRRGVLITALIATTNSAAVMTTEPVTQQSTGRSTNRTMREGQLWQWGNAAMDPAFAGCGHGVTVSSTGVGALPGMILWGVEGDIGHCRLP